MTSLVERLLSKVSRRRELKAKSQVRWVGAQPGTALTWGKDISGDPFITKVDQYAKFTGEKVILEIGPGYGRLIRSLIQKERPFSEYYAIDLSETNCRYLRKTFAGEKMHFLHDNAETVSLPKPFDIMYSSLTFKHLYPSFELVLRNLATQANARAVLVFDLLEGQRPPYFEEDGVTFIHYYTQQDANKILGRTGWTPEGFDYVEHDPENPERTRLVIVARKP